MHWNEKIDIIKTRYPSTQFLVPHVNRKRILRKIESQFIKRSASYYELNNVTTVFCNWWQSIEHEVLMVKPDTFFKFIRELTSNQFVWLAAEFSSGVLLYKATVEPLIDTVNLGSAWTRTFHVIHLKYCYMISFCFQDNHVLVKLSAEQNLYDPWRLRLKQL